MAIKEEFGEIEESEHARVLSDLLVANEKRPDLPARYGGLSLKPVSYIRELRTAHLRWFSLERFQIKFLRLVRRWADLALPLPELSRLGYGVGVTSACDACRRMVTLPSPQAANAPRSSTFTKKKLSEQFMSFTSDGAEESDRGGNAVDAVPASDAPVRRQAPQAALVSSAAAAGRKRRKFTDVEDEAIRKGIDECGFGNWKQIKAKYCMQLRNRSAIQVKDRARTLGISSC